jgi:hypothetical protein
MLAKVQDPVKDKVTPLLGQPADAMGIAAETKKRALRKSIVAASFLTLLTDL